MIGLQIERLNRCKMLDQFVVATSIQAEDEPIVNFCQSLGIAVFAGNLNNVLDRFYRTASKYHADHIARITGDCPLIDPKLIDELVEFYFLEECDYASNCRPPTLPDGLDAEIFSFHALETAWKGAQEPYDLEHVTPYILRCFDQFKLSNYRYVKDYSMLRWTVDYPEDFELVKKIYESLYFHNPEFDIEDIIQLIDRNPALKEMNIHYKRTLKYGKIKSI